MNTPIIIRDPAQLHEEAYRILRLKIQKFARGEFYNNADLVLEATRCLTAVERLEEMIVDSQTPESKAMQEEIAHEPQVQGLGSITRDYTDPVKVLNDVFGDAAAKVPAHPQESKLTLQDVRRMMPAGEVLGD